MPILAPLPGQTPATPERVARRRKLADALMQQGIDTSPVQHPFQALARIGQAGIGGYTDYAAGQQEEQGRSAANEQMAALLAGGNPDNSAIMGAMNNPWITDGQGRIASALLEQNLKRAQPDWQTQATKDGDILRWNQNDPNATPSVFYDAPPQPQDLMNVGKGSQIYDPNTKTWINPNGPGGAGPAPADIDDVVKLNKGFTGGPGVSRYSEVQPLIASMQASLSDPSVMADLDYIYGFAKILDPNSAVKEGEMGLVISSQSIPDSIQGQLNKLLNGQQAMTDKVRRDLFRTARRRAEKLLEQAQSEEAYYHGVGKTYGVTPDQFRPLDVLPEYEETPEQQPMAPPETQFDLMTQPQQPQGGQRRTRSGIPYQVLP